jgi:hypothetical protein
MELKKENIISAYDSRIEPVDVPEWGGMVYVKTMTGTERDLFDRMVLEGRGSDKNANIRNFRAKICVCCLCDSEGTRLFTDGEIEALGKKSSIVLDRISEVASKMNALGRADIEELEKNS